MTVTPYDQRLATAGPRAKEHELDSAYQAGRDKLPLPFSHPAKEDSDHQRQVRQAHAKGVADRRAETARRVAGRAARIAGTSGGYLASAGRSVRSSVGDIPTSSGSGTFLGVLVGVAALALLFVALNNAGKVAQFLAGVTSTAKWLIAPSPLPI